MLLASVLPMCAAPIGDIWEPGISTFTHQHFLCCERFHSSWRACDTLRRGSMHHGRVLWLQGSMVYQMRNAGHELSFLSSLRDSTTL